MDRKSSRNVWAARWTAAGITLLLAGCASAPTPTGLPTSPAIPAALPSATAAVGASSAPAQTSETFAGVPVVALTPLKSFATSFPQDIVLRFGSVWTANEEVDTVTRIDVMQDIVTAIKVDPAIDPQRIAASADAIWAAGKGGLVRIDPRTNAVVKALDGPIASLTMAFDSLWAGGHGNVVKLDPATGKPVARTQASSPDGDCFTSAAANAIWAGCGPTLDRIDPSSARIVATLHDMGDIPRLVSAGDRTWLKRGLDPFAVESAEAAYGRIDRFDPLTNALVPGTTVDLVDGASAETPVVVGDRIWYPTSFGVGRGAGLLLEFDAHAGKIAAVFDLSEGKGYGSNALAVGFGSLWTASGTANLVRRFPIPSD